MPENMVNGFNINGTPVPYNYDSLGNKLEKTSIAREYSNIDTYDVDEYVIYNGKMYRCKQKILVGESFDSTKWAECSIGPELNYIKKFVGFSEDAKYALLNLLAHVAYIDEHGQDYNDELEAALFQTAEIVSISAVFDQGSAVIYETDDLDTLRQYLTVTATYEDLSTREITAYTLSGTLEAGTSTITVSYGGKTDTFNVTVTHSDIPLGYTRVDYITSAVHGTPNASHLTDTPYIKTAFPANDTDIIDYSVELVFEPLFGGVNFCPFGGRNGTTAGTTTRGIVLTKDIDPAKDDTLVFGNAAGQTNCIVNNMGQQFAVNQKTKFKLEAKNIYIDDTLLMTVPATSAIQLAAYPWALFGRNNNGNYTPTSGGGNLAPMIGKVYSFSIKDGNGNYVLQYIPCRRNSDNVYGMYDTVSNSFLTSAISTAFSGGND